MASDRAPAAGGQPRRADLLSTLVATGLGSGYAPIAPGTAGSAVGLLLFWPLHAASAAVQLAAVAVLFVVGVAAATRVARGVGLEDPGIVVVDEVLGMWTSLLLMPFTPATAAAGFVLFRILDVFKPYPARQLESLPGGWGIMADDLMAGVYANLLLRAGRMALGAWE
jgi:phosphatidylglycerophosphatase A